MNDFNYEEEQQKIIGDIKEKQIVNIDDFKGKTIETIQYYSSELNLKFTDGSFALLEIGNDWDYTFIKLSDTCSNYTLMSLGFITVAQEYKLNKITQLHLEKERELSELKTYERLKSKYEK